MNKIKLSIIVPVYNTEQYLEKCLDSLVKQTLKEIEIILINDGSPDNSEVIIKKYLKMYNNIKYIKKDNGGLSSARNEGLKHVQGEYIGFVDSDDYVKVDMFEKMYNKIIKDKSDIVICDMVYELNGKDISDTNFKDFGILNKNEAILMYLDNNYFRAHVINKIFKKELFTGLTFLEGEVYEDVDIFYKLLHKSSKISFINEKLYFYNQGNFQSITKRKFNLKNIVLLNNHEKMIEFFKNNGYSKEICEAGERIYFIATIGLIEMAFNSKSRLSKSEFNEIRKSLLNSINYNIYENGRIKYYENNKNSSFKKYCYKINNVLKFYELKRLKNKIQTKK